MAGAWGMSGRNRARVIRPAVVGVCMVWRKYSSGYIIRSEGRASICPYNKNGFLSCRSCPHFRRVNRFGVAEK